MAKADVALPVVGKLFAGKYRIERLVGMGGMGAVYAAHHELLSERVAVKVLLGGATEDKSAVARFLNEARAAARIKSPHVVRVLDVGLLDGECPFLVMELLEGRDLGRVLERCGPLEPGMATAYVLEAMEALAQAHALGILHRDLKPSNLFLAERPDGFREVKVLDFGIAKVFGPAAGSRAAVTTQGLLGSPAYMAPEYVRTAKSVDARSDVWALGVILYELISGQLPFMGETVGEIFSAILETRPRSLDRVRADVPAGLSAAVMKCLAHKAEDRFAEVADLAEALFPFASAVTPSVSRIRTTVTNLRALPRTTGDGLPSGVRTGPASQKTEISPRQLGAETSNTWTESETSVVPQRRPRRVKPLPAAGAALALASFTAAGWFSVRSSATASAAAAPHDPVAAAGHDGAMVPEVVVPAASSLVTKLDPSGPPLMLPASPTGRAAAPAAAPPSPPPRSSPRPAPPSSRPPTASAPVSSPSAISRPTHSLSPTLARDRR